QFGELLVPRPRMLPPQYIEALLCALARTADCETGPNHVRIPPPRLDPLCNDKQRVLFIAECDRPPGGGLRRDLQVPKQLAQVASAPPRFNLRNRRGYRRTDYL